MKYGFLIVTLIITLSGCVKKQAPDTSALFGYNYYPTHSGRFVIYEVDSTVYLDLPKTSIQYKYRIKEKLTETFTDNEGKPAIKLERFIKKYDPLKSYDSIPWTIKEVWMVNASETSIQVSERDIRYTKLVFPVQERFSWKGNARNVLGDWDYTYEFVDKSASFGGLTLPKVLKVKQYELRTLISYKNYTEQYAKDIGLVYREITDIESNTVIPGVSVENRIEKGLIYKQTILSYGTE